MVMSFATYTGALPVRAQVTSQNNPPGISSLNPYFGARYDSPWFGVGTNGRLRFGLDGAVLGFDVRGIPAGSHIVSAALRYENGDLALGAGATRMLEASTTGALTSSYILSARYDTGQWYAGASYTGNWSGTAADPIDFGSVQLGYRPNDNLDVNMQYGFHIYTNGATPSRDRIAVNAKYTFDNGLFVGARLFRPLTGPGSTSRTQTIYAGWSFDFGG